MFQVEIEKRTGEPSARGRAKMAASGADARGEADLPTDEAERGASRRRRSPRYLWLLLFGGIASSMWKRSGSGWVVKSTLNRLTTV